MTMRIPGSVVVLVALCGAVSVAVAAMPVVSRLSAPQPTAKLTASPPADVAVQRADLTPILDFAPFGRAPAPVAQPGTVQAAAQIDLTLQGISASPTQAQSRAIIAGGVGDSASYAIGDMVSPGIILTGIATDHVDLTIAGAAQRLDFPMAATPVAADAPTVSSKLQNLIPTAQTAPDDLPATIRALRDDMQRNPQAVLARYGITAMGDGYLIGANAPDALLSAGLQPGDLVTQVNGAQVGDIMADRSFLDEVAASGQVQILALRAGEPLSLSVPLQ